MSPKQHGICKLGSSVTVSRHAYQQSINLHISKFALFKRFIWTIYSPYFQQKKFKVALKPLRRNFFNFAKSCILTCQSLFNNKKWGSPDSFLSYQHLKGKLRVFLTDKTVAIVTSDVMKRTATYSAMIGHLVDIVFVAATDKDL